MPSKNKIGLIYSSLFSHFDHSALISKVSIIICIGDLQQIIMSVFLHACMHACIIILLYAYTLLAIIIIYFTWFSSRDLIIMYIHNVGSGL